MPPQQTLIGACAVLKHRHNQVKSLGDGYRNALVHPVERAANYPQSCTAFHCRFTAEESLLQCTVLKSSLSSYVHCVQHSARQSAACLVPSEDAHKHTSPMILVFKTVGNICRKFDLLRLELSTAMELLQWPKLLGDDPKGDQVHVTRTQKGYYYVRRGEEKARIPTVCCLLLLYHTTWSCQSC